MRITIALLALCLATSASAQTSGDAAPPDQDALCMVSITAVLARVHGTDLPEDIQNDVQDAYRSLTYFMGATAIRFDGDALVAALRVALTAFSGTADKRSLAENCEARFNAAVQRLRDATRLAAAEPS